MSNEFTYLLPSIISKLLVPKIREAIAKSKVPRIYVCNIMTQRRQIILADIFDDNPHTYHIRHHSTELANALTSLVENITSGDRNISNELSTKASTYPVGK